jgi:translation initiation factor 2 beta subunit (eIF-2beta)/eIF-5
MKKFNTTIYCLFVAALLLNVAPAVQSRDLYRYYNDEGNMVVDYQVPAKYVGGGYEVLNDVGVVIKVVPRELTEEEKQAADAQQTLEQQALAEQERLRKWDESLLLRYSAIADIEDARERALSELRIRVSILKSNKRSLKQQVENYQAQAADLERSGQQVDVARLRVIEELQGEINITDRAIADRQLEIEQVAAAYQLDIERFEMLLEVVELRRTLIAQEREAVKNQSSDPRR